MAAPKKIEIADIRYRTELRYFELLKPEIQKLQDLMKANYQQFLDMQERGFMFQLSNSLRVNDFPGMRKIINALRDAIPNDFHFNIFVSNSGNTEAGCMVRRYQKYDPSTREYHDASEIIVILSQHFFNDLTYDEQLSIIGHEFGHVIFGHTDSHIQLMLDESSPLAAQTSPEVKMNALRWSICREISSDLVGLLMTCRKPQASPKALLKFVSGVSDTFLKDLGEKTSWMRIMDEQYQLVQSSLRHNFLSTHPLLPLRVKIMGDVWRSKILNQYGKPMSVLKKEELLKQLNQIIDARVAEIYPDIITQPTDYSEIRIRLCLAVMTADGKIDDEEVRSVQSMLRYQGNYATDLSAKIARDGADAISQNLLLDAIQLVREEQIEFHFIIQFIRDMFRVAIADGKFDDSEMTIITAFASAFSVDKAKLFEIYHNSGL